MSDRELLELAAKAAGIRINHWVYDNLDSSPAVLETGEIWTPLTDDGDALRLAVKLGVTVTPNYHAEQCGLGVIVFTELTDSGDFCAATRRAIVRAAAEIGRNKP